MLKLIEIGQMVSNEGEPYMGVILQADDPQELRDLAAMLYENIKVVKAEDD